MRSATLGHGALVLALAACSGQREPDTEPTTTTVQALSPASCAGPSPDGSCRSGTAVFGISLPLELARDDVALGALRTLRVEDRAHVLDASQAPGQVANATELGLTYLGVESLVGNVASNAAVDVRDRATVAGDLLSAAAVTLGNQVTITGTTAQGTSLAPKRTFDWQVTFEPAQQNLHLEPDQTLSIAPTRLGDVHVKSRSTLTLDKGVYVFDRLTIEPDAMLRLLTEDEPVFLFIRDALVFRGSIHRVGDTPLPMLVSYGGSDPVLLEAPFDGTVVAPYATIKLATANGVPHRGAYFGLDVELAANGRVIHEPFLA